jgi:hypothetical protein
MRSVIRGQLEVRFGPLEDVTREMVNTGSQEELERWCLAVVTARTIDEVF